MKETNSTVELSGDQRPINPLCGVINYLLNLQNWFPFRAKREGFKWRPILQARGGNLGGWCQEILRVMNWNLLIRDWKIQPEPDPIQEYFRGGQAGGRVGCWGLYLPGSYVHLKWRKPWHPVWGRKGKQMPGCAGGGMHMGSKSGQKCEGDQGVEGSPHDMKALCRCTPKLWADPCAPLSLYAGAWNVRLKPVRILDPVGACRDAPRIWWDGYSWDLKWNIHASL